MTYQIMGWAASVVWLFVFVVMVRLTKDEWHCHVSTRLTNVAFTLLALTLLVVQVLNTLSLWEAV